MATNLPTALVTGASGFTGRYVVAALIAHGYHVIGLGSELAGVHMSIAGDLTDAQSIDTVVQASLPDVVVHLAALSFVGQANIDAFYHVNVVGTLNLLEALEKLGSPPRKVLIASCGNIYGPQGEINKEGAIDRVPINHYAISKLTMDYMVQTWFSRFPIIITRAANIIGLGQSDRFPVAKLVEHFRRGDGQICLGNNIDINHDYSDVRDIAECYVALLESAASSQIINVCSGRARSLREIIHLMTELAGYEIMVQVDSNLMCVNEIQMPCDNNDLLHNLIGFTPQIPLIETLRAMFIGKYPDAE